MKLYNLPLPFPDELGYSWVERIAKANGFDKLGNMMTVFYDESIRQTNMYFKKSRPYDCIKFPEKICEQYNITILDFLKNLSMIPVFFPFIKREQQDLFLLGIFRKLPDGLTGLLKPFVRELHYCSACQEEDLKKNGVSYLRRIHQVPGVCKCPYHNNLLKNVDSHEVVSEGNILYSAQTKYTNFCNELLNIQLKCCIDDVLKAISKRMDDLNLTFATLKTRMIEDGYEYLLRVNNFYDCFNQVGVFGSISTSIKLIALCSYLFDNVDLFKQYLNVESNKERFERFIKKHKFILLSNYNESLVYLEHIMCGEKFFVSPHAIITGWGCPTCSKNKTNKGIFLEVLNKTDMGRYECVDSRGKLNSTEKIVHVPCGRTYEVSVRRFLCGHNRCTCSKLTQKQLNEYLQKNENFELVSFDERKHKVFLYSKKCKHFFDINYRKRPEKLKCPLCDDLKYYRFDSISAKNRYYKKRIKDLTGNEYFLCEDVSDKYKAVLIYHCLCGKSNLISMRAFCAGARCPECVPPIYKEEFVKIVKEESQGRYIVERFKRNSNVVFLRDTISNEVISIDRKLAIQELRRPTKSNLLPLVGFRKKQTKKSALLQDILKEYGYDKDFYVKDLNFPHDQYGNYMNFLLALKKDGYIIRTGRGKYRVVKTD